jgi:hypothetical protein
MARLHCIWLSVAAAWVGSANRWSRAAIKPSLGSRFPRSSKRLGFSSSRLEPVLAAACHCFWYTAFLSSARYSTWFLALPWLTPILRQQSLTPMPGFPWQQCHEDKFRANLFALFALLSNYLRAASSKLKATLDDRDGGMPGRRDGAFSSPCQCIY